MNRHGADQVADPYELQPVPYAYSRLSLTFGMAADILSLVGLLATDRLNGWKEAAAFVVAIGAVALIAAHGDYLVAVLGQQVRKLTLYRPLHTSYREAVRLSAQLQARVLAKEPKAKIIGTTVENERVYLLIAHKASDGSPVTRGDRFAVVQTIRAEVWGIVEVQRVDDGKGVAKVVDYSQNPVFWGFLENQKVHDPSVPQGLIAVRLSREET